MQDTEYQPMLHMMILFESRCQYLVISLHRNYFWNRYHRYANAYGFPFPALIEADARSSVHSASSAEMPALRTS